MASAESNTVSNQRKNAKKNRAACDALPGFGRSPAHTVESKKRAPRRHTPQDGVRFFMPAIAME